MIQRAFILMKNEKREKTEKEKEIGHNKRYHNQVKYFCLET